ncbi:hypothetical protein NLU14_11765 [Marinobacter sp. 71-i]|uniref:Uncharacterized protein n=1 Tax=Marinobacter iranensis TaxID=2962607 RepID=A0ABT5YB31_9GAMM|nr:hypothetical protein [Marinobacter iranensis]MDF0750900.1 hypothetical protein [Marinobacter iranensis]
MREASARVTLLKSTSETEKGGTSAYPETVGASKADGVNFKKKDLDEMLNLISNFNTIKTSMLVDK